MTIDEFIAHLDVHGADLERWPAELRDAGRRVAATPAGRSELTAARAFETLLEDSLPAPPEMGLKARILGRVPFGWPAWLAPARWRPLAAAAAAPLALGFVLGFASPNEDDGFEDAVSVLAFSPAFEEELGAEGVAPAANPTTEEERHVE